MELPSSYDPHGVETKWYRIWEDEGHFHAREDDSREPFSIVIPPPNVTGSLHMGHALNNTLQDILIRWQRMQGKSALWMPGMDHAGIATQNVVERLLREEGKTKHDLGREAFVAKVWDWKERYGGEIQGQLRRLGCSLDWPRERFTFDEGLSRAVRRVFVSLYQEGLIYQDYKIINWCPRCETALSDIETEYKDLKGRLYYIKYPIKGSKDFITVATTRPETMLGDTGVAVNPGDERYSHLLGKMLILPLMDREIPVFADDFVAKEFGTGLVKVTPAHDPNDFDMGKRHGLEEINILDPRGNINENGGPYKGLTRFAAREKIVEDLDKLGLLEKIEDYDHSVGHCYRCSTVIEPYLSKQWFVRIKPLAEAAIAAVKDGRIRFVPASWEKTYFEWMYNIRDWCISRQLWWGHRIPAYYCDDCGHITVSLDEPEACEGCASKNIRQDDDVLDTWFSSGLWPFSTMGWPDRTAALAKYYPTSVLVTAFDIIFFWVARMIMMGLKFMGDVPFREVYIHAIIRDPHGHKMSKSRGNVVDPLILMDQYGTDAFRFTLAVFAAQGRDIILSEKRIEGYRAFCNKIWNASRFILMNLGEGFAPEPIKIDALEPFDRWILHRLNATIEVISKSLAEYRFNEAAQAVYDFWWHEFCDWYLELTKPRIYTASSRESSDAAKQVLHHVLKNALALLHPFMPFITEEIWARVASPQEGRLIVAPWPRPRDEFNFEQEAQDAELFKEIVYRIRNIRGEMGVPPDRRANVVFKTKNARAVALIEREGVMLKTLARLENIEVKADYAPAKSDASAILPELEIYLPLKDVIDIGREIKRLEKEAARLSADLERVESKLANKAFTSKAPAEVVDAERAKGKELRAVLEKLRGSISKLS